LVLSKQTPTNIEQMKYLRSSSLLFFFALTSSFLSAQINDSIAVMDSTLTLEKSDTLENYAIVLPIDTTIYGKYSMVESEYRDGILVNTRTTIVYVFIPDCYFHIDGPRQKRLMPANKETDVAIYNYEGHGSGWTINGRVTEEGLILRGTVVNDLIEGTMEIQGDKLVTRLEWTKCFINGKSLYGEPSIMIGELTRL
jgi:hypothetical protein